MNAESLPQAGGSLEKGASDLSGAEVSPSRGSVVSGDSRPGRSYRCSSTTLLIEIR